MDSFLHTNRESKRMYRERLAELNVQHKIEATKVDAERAAVDRINAEANLVRETSIAGTRATLVEAIPRMFADLFAKATADPRDKDVKDLCLAVVGELHGLVADQVSLPEQHAVTVADDVGQWAPSQPPERVVTRGFAIQRYDDTGKTLIESYQCVSDAQRSFGGSVSAIKRAAKKHQV